MDGHTVRTEVYGKINLSLGITGVAEGYHLLDMVMASVDLADVVTICRRRDDILRIRYAREFAPVGKCAVRKAVDALTALAGPFGADIYVEKSIPVAGGLGGSSADAAGAIVGLDRLYGFSQKGIAIGRAANAAGSDVAYMLRGGYARVTGRGERVQPISSSACLYACLADRGIGVDTTTCFRQFDALTPNGQGRFTPANIDAVVQWLTDGAPTQSVPVFGNDLTAAAQSLQPDVGRTLDALRGTGSYAAFMSGSGSMCVGLYESAASARSACTRLQAAGFRAFAVHTRAQGMDVCETV